MSSGNKALLGGISAIVLVAAVIAVIATVSRSKLGGDISTPSKDVSKVSNGVEGICQSTDYKESCIKTLTPVLEANSSAEPKEVVKAAVKATMDEVQAAFARSKDIGKGTADEMNKAALSDCQELLQYAIDELQDALDLSGHDDKAVNHVADDLRNWLSAVISYHETCVDGLTRQEVKSEMKKTLVNATQLTSNALAIVDEVAKLLEGIEKALNAGGSSRRLLSDVDGYPEWLSDGDRRLLRGVDSGRVKPDVVVAKDGSGDFKTINGALKSMPKTYRGRYVIYVKKGVYKENVIVDKKKVNVFMYGDGPRKTMVTGKKNYVDGTPTYQTATFAAIGNGFIAKSMGFANTAGPAKHQAVALRVQSDFSAFFNCRMDAFQDTLYAQTHRQFYRNCVVAGTVDFIFGDSSAVLQNCLLIVRRPMDHQQCIVTAQGRSDRRQSTGIVIHNCRIVPDRHLYPDRFTIRSYLGRPWKQYSRTVFMESTIGDFIRPEGFMPWDGDFALKTLYYAEYANRGPGSNTANRVNWPGRRVITRKEAEQFTVARFIQGRYWLRYAGVPYILGFKR